MMRTSEVAKSVGAIVLGVVIAGGLVLGQRSGPELWLRPGANEVTDIGAFLMNEPMSRLARTAGPHPAPDAAEEPLVGPVQSAWNEDWPDVQLMQAQ